MDRKHFGRQPLCRTPRVIDYIQSSNGEQIAFTEQQLSFAWLLLTQVYLARFATRMSTAMSPWTLRQTVAL
jgi:hypothetical protein